MKLEMWAHPEDPVQIGKIEGARPQAERARLGELAAARSDRGRRTETLAIVAAIEKRLGRPTRGLPEDGRC